MPQVEYAEIIRRKKIIQNALHPYLPGNVIQEALFIAEAEFMQDAVFSSHRFLERIVNLDPRVPANKGKIFNGLQRLRTFDLNPGMDSANGSGTIPAQSNTVNVANGYHSEADNATASKNAKGWTFIFNSMMKELMLLLASLQPGVNKRIESHMRMQTPKMALTAPANEELLRWCRNSMLFQFNAIQDKDDMHKILHVLYLWCCEEMGPINTDRLFSRAIRVTEALPESIQYPPKSLL